MTRELLQNEAVKIGINNPYTIFEYPTGIGKSLIAIKIIEKVGGKWNIVLAETVHELNWINEFKKHNKEYLLPNITFFCYQSLHKHKDDENYILDEIHHTANSTKRLSLLNYIHLNNAKRLIGLSATLTKTQKESIEKVIGKFFLHKITLSQVIEWGILPEPTVYFIGVNLDNTVKNLKYYYGKEKFVMCTEQEYYDRITNRIESLKLAYFASDSEFDKIRWLREANIRKKFLASCKTKHAKELLHKLDNKRLICFTDSIAQSEKLSNGLSIHSKLSKKAVNKLVNDFNNGVIDKLFATGMLKEGVNLTNIEAGVIIQLDNNLRSFIQQLGRSLRAVLPEQYVLYIKNTQDETYIGTVLEEFNMEYVKFVELKDLK